MLEDLDFYLKTERKQSQCTINKHIQRVRKIIKLAFAEEFLYKDPLLPKAKNLHDRTPKRQDTKYLYQIIL